ncbi:hypothetical protein [Corynebacterium bouchesdurhonense]|nr:hypothetical protein [Corynebacterium bouchesdurhonense]
MSRTQIGERGKNYLVISRSSYSADYNLSLVTGPVTANQYGVTVAIELSE